RRRAQRPDLDLAVVPGAGAAADGARPGPVPVADRVGGRAAARRASAVHALEAAAPHGGCGAAVAGQRSISPLMNFSTWSRASSSEYCTGGDRKSTRL